MRRVGYAFDNVGRALLSVVQHWTLIESTEGAPLTLVDGSTFASANALLQEFDLATTALVGPENDAAIARSRLAKARANILRGAVDFRAAVKYLLAGTHFPRSLPPLESVTASNARIRALGNAVANLWKSIEQVQGPFLARGMTRIQFDARVIELRAAWTGTSGPRVDTGLARSRRNEAAKKAVALIKLYRQAIPVLFGMDSVYTKTLPYLRRRTARKEEAPPRG